MVVDGAEQAGVGRGDEPDDDDAGAFGDSGRFGTVSRAGGEINWPTVLVSAAVAAIVSSLFLALGVVGLQRGADSAPEIVVAVDPHGAVSVDGQTVTDGGAVVSSSSDLSPGATSGSTTTAASGEDGGGLSPATAAAAPTAVPAPGESPGTNGDTGGNGAQVGEAGATGDAPGAGDDSGPTDGERVTGWTPPGPLPADFAVTTDDPTLDDLNAIVHLLVATPADDTAKARNLEAGMGGVVVPRTVYNLGIFRAPQGWKRITGPVERNGDSITATLHSESAGRPSINTRVVFVKHDGNWKLSTRSVCEGVRTVGLPIACGG